MTRMAWIPWCEAIDQILPGVLGDDWDETKVTVHELHDMWDTDPQITPVEAAAAITVAEFERSFNA